MPVSHTSPFVRWPSVDSCILQGAVRQKREEDAAEQRNIEEHTWAGTLIECQCCFADVPPNRAIPCQGDSVHFFCFSCICQGAETQIGQMQYKLQCFDTSGCQAGFARSELKEALGASIMDKLDSLQQQDEIARADIEGLDECPFCEFKAICPPEDEDREFRCFNPDCEKVSCRLCNTETHIPKTCEEARRDRGVSERHQVEEAMSEALIRNCPRCNVPVVKESGCNKMSCPYCRCLMCYICKKDITREGYDHFRPRPGGCRVEDEFGHYRAQQEIRQAEEMAIERAQAENPGLTRDELVINNPECNAGVQAPGHLDRARLHMTGDAAHRQMARVKHEVYQRARRPVLDDLVAARYNADEHMRRQLGLVDYPAAGFNNVDGNCANRAGTNMGRIPMSMYEARHHHQAIHDNNRRRQLPEETMAPMWRFHRNAYPS